MLEEFMLGSKFGKFDYIDEGDIVEGWQCE